MPVGASVRTQSDYLRPHGNAEFLHTNYIQIVKDSHLYTLHATLSRPSACLPPARCLPVDDVPPYLAVAAAGYHNSIAIYTDPLGVWLDQRERNVVDIGHWVG